MKTLYDVPGYYHDRPWRHRNGHCPACPGRSYAERRKLLIALGFRDEEGNPRPLENQLAYLRQNAERIEDVKGELVKLTQEAPRRGRPSLFRSSALLIIINLSGMKAAGVPPGTALVTCQRKRIVTAARQALRNFGGSLRSGIRMFTVRSGGRSATVLWITLHDLADAEPVDLDTPVDPDTVERSVQPLYSILRDWGEASKAARHLWYTPAREDYRHAKVLLQKTESFYEARRRVYYYWRWYRDRKPSHYGVGTWRDFLHKMDAVYAEESGQHEAADEDLQPRVANARSTPWTQGSLVNAVAWSILYHSPARELPAEPLERYRLVESDEKLGLRKIDAGPDTSGGYGEMFIPGPDPQSVLAAFLLAVTERPATIDALRSFREGRAEFIRRVWYRQHDQGKQRQAVRDRPLRSVLEILDGDPRPLYGRPDRDEVLDALIEYAVSADDHFVIGIEMVPMPSPLSWDPCATAIAVYCPGAVSFTPNLERVLCSRHCERHRTKGMRAWSFCDERVRRWWLRRLVETAWSDDAARRFA